MDHIDPETRVLKSLATVTSFAVEGAAYEKARDDALVNLTKLAGAIARMNMTGSERVKARRLEKRAKARADYAKYVEDCKRMKVPALPFKPAPVPPMVTIFHEGQRVYIPAAIYANSPKFARHFKDTSRPFRM